MPKTKTRRFCVFKGLLIDNNVGIEWKIDSKNIFYLLDLNFSHVARCVFAFSAREQYQKASKVFQLSIRQKQLNI